MKRTLLVTMLGALLTGTGIAAAETLYKLIDKNGKITYSEEKPKQFDGQVIRLDIDPNATTVTLPKFTPAAPSAAQREASSPAAQARARLEDAQDRLARAKAALANARDNPGEGDFQIFGNVSGGVRRYPTEAYQQRLSRLEEEVRNAETAVQTLEKGR